MAPSAVDPAPQTESAPNGIHPSFLDRLDNDFIEYYNEHFASKPATHTIPVSEIRTGWQHKYRSPWCRDYSGEPLVKDLKIQSDDGHIFTARCYYPDPEKWGPGPYPVYINFHGGGFTFGDLTGDAELCDQYRTRVGVLAIDVDYRLCPEFRFGKGHEDAWAALRWVHNHGKELNAIPESISIGGISAGGHISAVLQQQARDSGLSLKLAVLAVPAVTSHAAYLKASDAPWPSCSENEFAPCLNWARILYFRGYSRPDGLKGEVAHIVRQPLDGNLHGVCPTIVLTAACDPIRDEGEAYAQKLIKEGVLTTVRRYSGVPHPFMHMSPIKKAQIYVEDVCAALKAAHGL